MSPLQFLFAVIAFCLLVIFGLSVLDDTQVRDRERACAARGGVLAADEPTAVCLGIRDGKLVRL